MNDPATTTWMLIIVMLGLAFHMLRSNSQLHDVKKAVKRVMIKLSHMETGREPHDQQESTNLSLRSPEEIVEELVLAQRRLHRIRTDLEDQCAWDRPDDEKQKLELERTICALWDEFGFALIRTKDQRLAATAYAEIATPYLATLDKSPLPTLESQDYSPE